MLRKFICVLCALTLGCILGVAQPLKVDSTLYLELQRRLAEAPNQADSLDIAIDLFDLNFNDESSQYGELAYKLAIRRGDTAKAMSMVRQLAQAYQNNLPGLKELERRVQTLPNSSAKSELLTYLSLRKIYYEVYDLSADERNKRMKELTNVYMASEPTDDIYTNIHRLFELCIYLHARFESSATLSNYFERLGNLIESLPPEQMSLRRLYYSMSAISFSKQFMPEKAIEQDKKLIECLRTQRDEHLKQGRRYRTYDSTLYTTYSRILSNYEALSDEEVDEYYGKIIELTDNNQLLKNTMLATERPQMYYYMAKKRYKEALPLLKKHVDDLYNRKNALYFNRTMMKAAEGAGDTQAYAKASATYIKLLENYIRNHTANYMAELSITYDLSRERDNNQRLINERDASRNAASRQLLIYITSVALLLLLLVVILLILWRRRRKSERIMAVTLAELKQERDNLQRMQSDLIMARDQAKAAERQKTDFIHMISHQVKAPLQAISEYTGLIVDCMDEEKRGYLGRFAEVVQLNTELINSLVNDITEISALEANEIEVRIRPTSLREICLMAIDSVRPSLPEGLEIELIPTEDYTIATDRRRLEQILTNVLENAVKFSEHGTISIDYHVDKERRRVDISVADQGIGIPAEKQEIIFNRFAKVDNSTPGMGLGLYVTRLLVRLMSGEIHVDPNYKGGSRFVVSLRAKVS